GGKDVRSRDGGGAAGEGGAIAPIADLFSHRRAGHRGDRDAAAGADPPPRPAAVRPAPVPAARRPPVLALPGAGRLSRDAARRRGAVPPVVADETVALRVLAAPGAVRRAAGLFPR